MNLSEISIKLTGLLTKELDYDEDKKEIIAYGIETTLLTILAVLLTVLVGVVVKALTPIMTAFICGGLLRKVSGGAHLHDPMKCLVFGTFCYSAIGLFSQWLVIHDMVPETLRIVVLLGSFVTVILLAPVDSPAKPIHSLTLKKKLKIASAGFVIAVFLVTGVVHDPMIRISATLGILYQAITLLPILNKKEVEQL